MNTAEKAALVENILTRAGELIGDVTPAVMEIYYRQHPEALAAFEAHGLGKRSHLDGMMIENSLHCLMHWLQSPGEVEILLSGSVPHHRDTLQVTPQLYSDFLETTAEVIARTIPPKNTTEATVWNEVRGELHDVVKQSSGF